MKGRLFFYGSIILVGLMTTHCFKEDEEPIPRAFVISNLTYSSAPILITQEPYFTISGSLKFTGAVHGVSSLKLTSSLGGEVTVPITGVSQSNGLLEGYFTFEMINMPGTYTFQVWLIDQADRPSNKLSGSITMIEDPNKQPTPVVLNSVVFDAVSQSPVISWTKNMDTDFYAYIITRHIDDPTQPWHGEQEEVIRVYDQNVTSAYDPNNHGTIGFSYAYNVEVSNNKFTVPSNYISLTYPAVIELADKIGINMASRPVVSQQRNELYFLDDGRYWGKTGTLVAFSTVSNTLVRSFDFNMFLSFTDFTLSKDESKIYCTLEDSLFVINAIDFSLIKSMHLNFTASDIALGRAGRLYVRCVAPAAEKGFKILDAETGLELGSLNKSFQMLAADDGNTVYGIGPTLDENGFPTGTNTLWRIDVTTDVPLVSQERELGSFIYGFGLSSDEERLYVAYNNSNVNGNEKMDEVNAATLAPLSTSDQPWLRGFILMDNYFIAVNADVTGNYNFIKRIRMADNALLDSWQLQAPEPSQIQISNTGNQLYIFGRRSWVINLSD